MMVSPSFVPRAVMKLTVMRIAQRVADELHNCLTHLIADARSGALDRLRQREHQARTNRVIASLDSRNELRHDRVHAWLVLHENT